ncbi:MAG: DEAD/DEAH box helicase [Pseudomonadota bacterium]
MNSAPEIKNDPGDKSSPPIAETTVERLIELIKRKYGERITGELIIPPVKGKYSDFPAELDNRLRGALLRLGIARLYSHQYASWTAAISGRHLVITTPTASGKTLCYNLPVLQAVLRERAKALYLFPTKALSQDQVAEILEINDAGDLGIRVYTFDGDTPGDARKAVRTRGDIVVSNPDMLHQGILPHHTKWAQFFENLKYIVIDELHTYRGVFGSHMGNVIRRLKRICRFYGASPIFILSSATIANPRELAEQLIEEPVAMIDQSGAPRGKKYLLLWNPPVINADLGIRASSRSQVTRLARLSVTNHLKTIIFANTRLMVEVITKYMKDVFDRDPRKPARVAAYRGGYLPTERRSTEKRLRSGHIDCVIATSALELGVDIGSLDVCLLNGYPGTIAGTWQRIGRAGRRNRTSFGVLVATSNPLDQYIVRNAGFFLGSSPEHARIDPDHLLILMDHVRCAAFELAFEDGEVFGRENLSEVLAYLEGQGVLHHEGSKWHWMTDSYPANSVSLRSVAEGNFVVVDITDGKSQIIAEVDYSSAPMTVYEGAIYMVQAQPWQVERLDWEGRKAYVKRTQADYYTDAIDYTKLNILDRFEEDKRPCSVCTRGEVHLVRHMAGYKKIRYYTHENVGYGQINLPDQEMHTTAVWWQANPGRLLNAFPNQWQALDGFLGAAYAMHYVAALLSMSERQDLGRAVGDGNSGWFAAVGVDGRGKTQPFATETVDLQKSREQFVPTVFLYDNYPGGIGLSTLLYDLREEVVKKAGALIGACECSSGCPACIGPILPSLDGNNYSPKAAAMKVLEMLKNSAE